jgi:maltose-binding protein MalE
MRRLVSFLKSAPETAIAPDVGFNPEVADAFLDAAALVLGGKATPAAALADAERQVQALRKE